MSDPVTAPTSDSPEVSGQTPSLPTPEGVQTVTAASGTDAATVPTDAEPETFPRSYVEELRKEAKTNRQKASRADRLASALVTSMVDRTGLLVDASDLPFDPVLLDDDGMPDTTKVAAAIDELLKRKPHLARIKVSGDVGQGARTPAPQEVSLASLLRQGAG